MNLFKRTQVNVDGWNEGLPNSHFYFLTEESFIEDEKPVTYEDVVEEDSVYLCYNKYENLGNITEDEIKTLKKFEILNATR
jgi:hypothetical protein